MTKRSSQFRLKPIKAVALVVLLMASTISHTVLAAEYIVTDLGTLGGSDSFVSDINESGQVVGMSRTADGALHAFLYSGGIMTDLGTLGGTISSASGINATGQVVGNSHIPGNSPHAFLYSGGTMMDLGTLGGTISSASGINATGQIVGNSHIPGNSPHAFVYSGAVMSDLNALIPVGVTLIGATDINDASQIVGASNTLSNINARHAFLYSGGTVTDLGTLGGSDSFASAINATGQVVGHSQIPDNSHHAFLYSGGTMTDLGTLGGTHSFAQGINAVGQVVGRSYLRGDLTHHAFLYSSGTMTDLNDLVPTGVTVTNATGINTAGQIVADGRIDGSSKSHALLLSPILLNRFAYALADSLTAASYTPDSRFAYNSSGGAISVTRQGEGVYDVAFDGLPASGPNLSSAVAVTAHGSSPITCSVLSYNGPAPTRTVVQVACFDAEKQIPADSRFTIMVVGNQSLPLQSAFVMSGGPAPVPPLAPARSWTRGTNPFTVTHNPQPGSYDVLLGMGNNPQSAKLVTGTTGVGTRCHHVDGISGGLLVRCYDRTGAESDQSFSVVQVAGGRPGRRIGFAWADQPGRPSYTPNPNAAFNSAGGAITATQSSAGHYAMHFAGLQNLTGHPEHVQVTARQQDGLAACKVVSWENVADGLTVFVECRDGAGRFKNARYNVLVIE